MNAFLDMLKKLLTPGPSTSGKFKLDLTDLIKLLKTAGYVGGGAAVAYVLANIAKVDFNGADPDTATNGILILISTVALEAIGRFFKKNETPEQIIEKMEEKKEEKKNG